MIRIRTSSPGAAAVLLCRCVAPTTDRPTDINQSGDTSDGLEIASSDALELNGASIRRVSTSPTQDANVVFYSGGDEDSDGGGGGTQGLYGLSLRGDDDGDSSSSADSPPVVIDCSDAPVVISVTATAFAGEYGAGQRIYFQVRPLSRHNLNSAVPVHTSVLLHGRCCLLHASCGRHGLFGFSSRPVALVFDNNYPPSSCRWLYVETIDLPFQGVSWAGIVSLFRLSRHDKHGHDHATSTSTSFNKTNP